VIGMMVRQDQPPDRLARDGADDAHQLLPLRGTRERIDHHYTVTGHYEAGVGAALRAPPRVTHNHVDAGCQLADGKLLRAERRDDEKRYTKT